MKLKIGGLTLEAKLNDSAQSQKLQAMMPLEISMSRWGDEYYGRLPKNLPALSASQEYFDIGEIALWPAGNSLCIFFGRTPASTDGRPKMASPGISLGFIVSDTKSLKSLPDSIRISLTE